MIIIRNCNPQLGEFRDFRGRTVREARAAMEVWVQAPNAKNADRVISPSDYSIVWGDAPHAPSPWVCGKGFVEDVHGQRLFHSQNELNRANLQLAAAAPSLLKACERWMLTIESNGDGDDYASCVAVTQWAIHQYRYLCRN
ncbi:MAG: hypothetical protein ACQESR_30695 [Planctomycetota bacterium]